MRYGSVQNAEIHLFCSENRNFFFVKSLHLFQLFYMNNTVLSFTLHLSPVDNQWAKGEGSIFHLLFWMAAISRSVFSSVVAQLVQMRTAV